MEQGWLQDTPQLNANEADYLVEMWLRRRLQAPEQTPLDTNKLSLRELALALGTTEQDLAMLLCEIRDKRTKKKSLRLKRAMPIRKTVIFIAGIYTAVFALCFAMWNMGYNSARGRVHYYPDYYQNQAIYVSHSEPGHPPLDDAIGFQYQNTTVYSIARGSAKNIDWKAVQVGLEDRIDRIGGSTNLVLAESLSQKEIEASLAKADGVLARNPNRYDGYSLVPPSIPDYLHGDRLVDWEVFTLNFGSRSISTPIPIAKVANPMLDAAIKAKVRGSLSKILDVVKSTSSGVTTKITR